MLGPAIHPAVEGARPRGKRRTRGIPAVRRRPKGLGAVTSGRCGRIRRLVSVLGAALRHRRRRPLHHVVVGLSTSGRRRSISFDAIRPPRLDRLPHSPHSPSHTGAPGPPEAARRRRASAQHRIVRRIGRCDGACKMVIGPPA